MKNMSQRDHWKKKRPAKLLLKERKSWLSVDTTRDGTVHTDGNRRNTGIPGNRK
jgi:hypothetical protein